jgi:acetyl-CoA carboxylase biotin carboxyl carrier protein
VQFPLDTVREVAQLLSETGLSEISLQTTGEGPASRLTLRRGAPVVAAPVAVAVLEEEAVIETSVEEPAGPRFLTVTSTAVGVFRAAKPLVEVGDEVRRKQLLAAVEALKVPIEVYAPEHGRVVEVLATEGQGVEWGQPLFILEPIGK